MTHLTESLTMQTETALLSVQVAILVQCPAWTPGSVFQNLSSDTQTQTFRHIIGNTSQAVVKGDLSPLGLLRESVLILTAVLVKAGQILLNKSVLYYLHLILLYFLYFFVYFLSFYFNQQWRPLPAQAHKGSNFHGLEGRASPPTRRVTQLNRRTSVSQERMSSS